MKNFTNHDKAVKPLIFPVKPYGIVTFFYAETEQPVYLVLPDTKEPVRVRGAMKRLILTLGQEVATGAVQSKAYERIMVGGLN